ncbi:MAG: hypothetical protein AAF405_05865 [Pseudomonadota bacterium]
MLCCGRTFLSAGLVDEARAEAERTLNALEPWLDRGVRVVGLEPSCLFTFRDEFGAILPGAKTERLAEAALLFEELLGQEQNAQQLQSRLQPVPWKKALLHGHCHQKAFGVMGSVQAALGLGVKTWKR